MGLFKDLQAAASQRERVLALKSDLIASDPWKKVAQSASFGSGIRVGFATVACRRCMKSEAGLLLDQSLWEWQTHQVSYCSCLEELSVWVAENQGPQAAKSQSEWLDNPWTKFDERTFEASSWVGKALVSSKRSDSIEHWIIDDFMVKGLALKRRIAAAVRDGSSFQHKVLLQQFLELEGLDF